MAMKMAMKKMAMKMANQEWHVRGILAEMKPVTTTYNSWSSTLLKPWLYHSTAVNIFLNRLWHILKTTYHQSNNYCSYHRKGNPNKQKLKSNSLRRNSNWPISMPCISTASSRNWVLSIYWRLTSLVASANRIHNLLSLHDFLQICFDLRAVPVRTILFLETINNELNLRKIISRYYAWRASFLVPTIRSWGLSFVILKGDVTLIKEIAVLEDGCFCERFTQCLLTNAATFDDKDSRNQ